MQALLGDMNRFYRVEGRRHLPWRRTFNPYRILVSEIMLQQTQVSRVIPFYIKFIKKFGTVQKLADATLKDVLKSWSGLGYNRRAKFLHEAAKKIIKEYGGKFPRAVETIETLPGVGKYTARAIAAFAYNKREVFIETNIRTAFLHYVFLQKPKMVSDAEILPLVEKALKKSKMQPRDFYAALMDYGSYLKSEGVRLNKKSKHYIKQKKFEGSPRQLRGTIIRELLKGPATLSKLTKNTNRSKGEAARVMERLVHEGLVGLRKDLYSLDG